MLFIVHSTWACYWDVVHFLMYITVVIGVLTGCNRGSNTAVAWFGAHVVLSIKLIRENVIE